MTITSDWTGRPSRLPSSFAPAILGLAVVVFLLDFIWMVTSGQMFLMQLPILLVSFFLILFLGLGYVLDPPAWVGLALFGFVYSLQDLTIRQGLVAGGGTDLQSIVKGGMAALLAVYGLFHGMNKSFKHPLLAVWLAYAAFGLASSSYSSARALGIGSGVALLGISFATSRAATGGTSMVWNYWRTTYLCAAIIGVVSLAILAVAPLYARDLADPGAFRMRGITGSANSLGPIMAVGAIVSISMFKLAGKAWQRHAYVLLGLMFVVALVLTNSRSTIIGFAACLPFVAVVARRQWIWSVLVGLLALSVGLALVLEPNLFKGLLAVFTELFSRSGHAQEITSMTGRSEIWAACWKLIKAHPWLGYGLGSVRVEIPKVFFDQWGNTAATAHNFFLESMISVGLLGTALLMAVLAWTFAGLLRYVGGAHVNASVLEREVALSALRCLTMLLIHSMVERAFAGMAAPSTLILGLCAATLVHLSLPRQAA